MKKKLLAFVLVAGMVLSLTACGTKENDPADAGALAAEQPAEPEEPGTQEEVSAPGEAAPEEEEAEPEEIDAGEEASASGEPASGEEDTAMTLEDWLQSDAAKQTEDITNASLADSGVSVKFKADGDNGDIFVYEYTIPDTYSELSDEELAATLDSVIESYEEGVGDIFEGFDSEYGIKLGGVRFTFVISDGTELYFREIANG